MNPTKSARRRKGASRLDRALAAALRREDALVPFGPTFFLTRLAAFVRDRCPGPAERLPTVLVHLADGEVLDLCHVIGASVHWVALATRAAPKDGAGSHPMWTVLVPYSRVVRITMQPESLDASGVGFRQARAPVPLPADGGETTGEAAFSAAAGAPVTRALHARRDPEAS